MQRAAVSILAGVEIGEFVDGPVGAEPQVLADLVLVAFELPPAGAGLFEPEVDPVVAVVGTEVQALS